MKSHWHIPYEIPSYAQYVCMHNLFSWFEWCWVLCIACAIPKPWAVYLIWISFKTVHIWMCGEMIIGLILELASHLSMIEEIYGGLEKAFIYGCYVLPMDNFGTYVMLWLFRGCFPISQSDSHSLLPSVRYSIEVCLICFHRYFHNYLLALIIFSY